MFFLSSHTSCCWYFHREKEFISISTAKLCPNVGFYYQAAGELWDQLDPSCAVTACPSNLLIIHFFHQKIVFFTHPIA